MSGEDHEGRPVAEDASGSPSPGDTLPWNLGKTQRSRRSGGGSGGNGSVLDPAERAVIRIAGNAEGPCLPSLDVSTRLLAEHLLSATCGCQDREGRLTGWSRGTLRWQVIAGPTAPPAGPLLSAAGGLRLRPEVESPAVAPSLAHDKEPVPRCHDTALGFWGRAAFQAPCSWLPPVAVWGSTQERERRGPLVG